MLFFKFSLKDIPAEELGKLVQNMRRTGPQMFFPQVATIECYAVFITARDAESFRQYLRGREAAYTEPGDLPNSIKESPEYKFFLKAIGL